ncbi:hypothetical protein [Pseudomonas sp. VI4.1]|uniref:hypothetical protein n=1 Tax=Pseudomonas sp. VI4.1 TaxID=1941346 RepID=UPI0009C4A4A1|nr:hypothetical protein [Pseudomonas sp. VI4.1]OPK06788.1 hypothetical protein BZ163_29740 [Pseudomonas sp. VI4.1]
MNPKLQILERRLARQSPEKIPAPADDDLAAAIQRLVDQRVADALERQPVKPPARVQRVLDQFDAPKPYTSFDQIPATPKTPAPKAREISLQRDELGRINIVNAGGMQWYAQRNELGDIVRLVPADITPMPPAIEPPALAAARKYNPGEPR